MSASPVGMHAVLSNATVRRVPLNEYYGHAAVLREFCGVTDDRAIRGHLQHGWSPSPAADMRLHVLMDDRDKAREHLEDDANGPEWWKRGEECPF